MIWLTQNSPFTFIQLIYRNYCHPPVLLPGKSHGWRSLEGCSPWGGWGSDTTEWLHFHFSLSCIGEGNGNPLQCSCLENPRYRGAWWAAIYGVVQSQTRLKQLSSSSNGLYLLNVIREREGESPAIITVFPGCCGHIQTCASSRNNIRGWTLEERFWKWH